MSRATHIMCAFFAASLPVAFSFGGANPRPYQQTLLFKPLQSVLPSTRLPLYATLSPSSESAPTPLCDLQTFLRLTKLVQSGGQAKTAIQGEECYLNGEVEIRRAKKLFPGDEVFFGGVSLDVSDEVVNRGYVYKPKKKKSKPVARINEDGSLEFGGRYRSEEWREERKKKKEERKKSNAAGDA